MLNTLAAVAVGMELNLDFDTVAASLKDFGGVQRRFEVVEKSDELILVDDYGHHPAEIQATLKTAKEVWPNRRLIVVFQPHRYSRTQSLMKAFWSAFNDADHLLVTDIYSAGELPIEGVDASQIAEGVREFGHKEVEHIGNDQVSDRISRLVKPGDVVMTLGAGDVWKLGRNLLATLTRNKNNL